MPEGIKNNGDVWSFTFNALEENKSDIKIHLLFRKRKKLLAFSDSSPTMICTEKEYCMRDEEVHGILA